MKNSWKNIAILFFIFACIPAIFAYFPLSFIAPFGENALSILLLQYFKLLVFLLPVILIVLLVNKFCKNRKIRLSSLFICLYAIYFFISLSFEEYIFLPFCNFAWFNVAFFIYLLSLGMLLMFCVPQRILQTKFDVIIFAGKLLLVSVIVSVTSLLVISTPQELLYPYSDEVLAPKERYKLSKYEQVFDYLKEEKNKNGSYPQELNYSLPKIFNFSEYKVSPDFNSFIFCVYDRNEFAEKFCYCSNEQDEYCNKKTSDFIFKKIGKWTAIIWAN